MKILENKDFQKFLGIVQNISKFAEIYLVGGIVRDFIMGKESKDIDVLIRNVEMDLLIQNLSQFGNIKEVGKSFGVLKFNFFESDLMEVDIAFPRVDYKFVGFEITQNENNFWLPIDNLCKESLEKQPLSKNNIKFLENLKENMGFDFEYHNFQKIFDYLKKNNYVFSEKIGYTAFRPFISHENTLIEDLSRRDITINSMAYNCLTNELVDVFGGLKDIENAVIRMTSKKAFGDDPLRMLRAVQFASRFNFEIERETFYEIKKNSDKIKTISFERILIEFEKIFKKGNLLNAFKYLDKTKLLLKYFEMDFAFGYLFKDVKYISEFFYVIKKLSNNFGNFLNQIDNTIKKEMSIFEKYENQTNEFDKFVSYSQIFKLNDQKIKDSKIFDKNLVEQFEKTQIKTTTDLRVDFKDYPEIKENMRGIFLNKKLFETINKK